MKEYIKDNNFGFVARVSPEALGLPLQCPLGLLTAYPKFCGPECPECKIDDNCIKRTCGHVPTFAKLRIMED
jgi:hypothetical protein